MYSLDEIYLFLEKQTGCSLEEINKDTDIFSDLGIVGDDFHEMMDSYFKQFHTDPAGYLWYFHADEEGGWNDIGGAFFNPPYNRVNRIPVTPAMLQGFANEGKWGILYPEHKLPKRRYDLLINRVLLFSFLIYLLYWWIK